jgi:hypothetical protein
MVPIDYANVLDAASALGLRIPEGDPLARYLLHSLGNSLPSWTPRDLSVALVQCVVHRIQLPAHIIDEMLVPVQTGDLEVLVRGLSGVAHLEHMPSRAPLEDLEERISAKVAEVRP